jgi:superkiller protein 3
MLTFLAILICFMVIVGVFVHRWYALKKATFLEKEAEKNKENQPETEEEKSRKRLTARRREEITPLLQEADNALKYGKDDEAIRALVQVLSIFEEHHEAKEKLAFLYFQKQKFNSAAALFEDLAEKQNDPKHYSHLGLCLYQQSNYEEALKAYQAAVDLDETRPARFVSLAQVYRALSKNNHAIIALKKALDLDEKHIDGLALLVDLYFEAQDKENTLHHLRKLVVLAPENEEVRSLEKKVREGLVD